MYNINQIITIIKNYVTGYLYGITTTKVIVCVACISICIYLYAIATKKRISFITYFGLSFSIFFILMFSFLGREFGSVDSPFSAPFDTYMMIWNGNTFAQFELIFNIVLYIPFGCFLGYQKKYLRKSGTSVFLCSFVIEIMQGVCKCGTFEICDIINNSIGGIIGILIVLIIRRLLLSRNNK